MSPLIPLLLLGLTLGSDEDYDTPSSILRDVTEDSFNDVINMSEFVLVDFYLSRSDMAIPSDPTTTLSTFVVAERLSHLTHLTFGKIEIRKYPALGERFEVKPTVFPTKILFRKGEVLDTIRPDSRDLYYPDILEKWLIKRVVGPVLPLDKKHLDLAEGEAIVLILQDPPPQQLNQASLQLSHITFYSHDEDLEYSSKHLLQGGVYVIRNFIGMAEVESLDISEEQSILTELQKLITPPVVELNQQVFGSVQMREQWMLGLALDRSRGSHEGLMSVFVDAMKQLVMILETEVQGVYLDMSKDTTGDKTDMTSRLVQFFSIEDTPAVFLFKKDDRDLIKELMKTELTDHNIKTFLFDQIQKRFKDKKEEKEEEEKKGEMRVSETPSAGWKDKRIKPLVGATLPGWIQSNTRKLLVLLCYKTSSPELTRALLKLNKLAKELSDHVEFGKLNTLENDVEVNVPDTGVVLITQLQYGEVEQISTEILMRTLDVEQLGSLVRSLVANKSLKQEL